MLRKDTPRWVTIRRGTATDGKGGEVPGAAAGDAILDARKDRGFGWYVRWLGVVWTQVLYQWCPPVACLECPHRLASCGGPAGPRQHPQRPARRKEQVGAVVARLEGRESGIIRSRGGGSGPRYLAALIIR